MKKCWTSFFLLLFALASQFVLANSSVTLPHGTKKFDVSDNVKAFFDKNGNLQFADILADTTLFHQQESSFEFGEGTNVVWIKFCIKNEFHNDEKFILNFYSRWDTIRFYSFEDGQWKQELTGGLVSINNRTEHSPYSLVNVLLKKGENQTFFARLQYNGNWRQPTGFTSFCVEKNTWLEDLKGRNFIQGLFLGIIFIMTLYNLFLYFSVRDKSYLFYVMTLFAMGLIFLSNYRYDYEYLWPNCPVLARILNGYPFYNAFAGFWILVFSQAFLNTKKNIPTIHFVMNMVNSSTLLVLVLSLFHVIDSGDEITDMIGVVVLSLTLLSGILVFRKGYKPAKYFVMANTFFCLGTILFLLQNKFNIIPFDLKTYPMQIGSTIEMVLFSLAIADRINILKSEVSNKQEKIISQLRENELLKDEVTRELENKVKERTIELTKKNQEVTDSITYAKRIQTAKLLPKSDINLLIKQCFVLFKPKDIVSGDFYFLNKKEDSIIIAAADCTGHGVPGAFMSMIGSERLEDAVLQTTNPSEILNLLNRGIKTSLRQSDKAESTKDGMDIAICSIDLNKRIVNYAGANRPFWLIRKNTRFVEEIKATKSAIAGFTRNDQYFETSTINLSKGDTFYIFTDGYADQFGGVHGKKLMTKKFKEILIEIQEKSMNEQEIFLNDFIEDWKSKTDQVDDILVIGIRI